MRLTRADGDNPEDSLKTLAILLGPYRNLSTLTAAALTLHPNVQVLNHAAERLWTIPGIDFLVCPQQSVYRQFLAAAVRASEDGQRGDYGGSILHSHAFDDPSVRLFYERRYGDRRIKATPLCLVWKDSMKIQRRLAADPHLLPAIIANLPEVRFILPIRQPIDCAESNMRTGHVKHLMSGQPAGIADAVDAVLRAIAWGLIQRDRWPDRFFVFTERMSSIDLAHGLADHLGLPDDPQWLRDFRSVFRVRREATRSADLLQMERGKITGALSRWPDVRDALLV